MFQVAGQCGLGVLSAAKEKGVFGIGVDADQGYLGTHVLTSAMKKVDVAVYEHDRCRARRRGANFKDGYNAIFTVKNGGVGYGKISLQGRSRSWRRRSSRSEADRGRQDQGHPSASGK